MYHAFLPNCLTIIAIIMFGIPISIIDSKTKLISPVLAIGFAILGAVFFLFFRWDYENILGLAIGVTAISCIGFLLKDRIGRGDLKLLAMLLLWVPFRDFLYALVYLGALSLFALAIVLLNHRRTSAGGTDLQSQIPFAPVIFSSFLIEAIVAMLL